MAKIRFLGLMLIIVVISLVMSGGIADAQNQQLDSSDRTNSFWITPELIGQIGGPTYAVARQGNYAYVGVGPRLYVLDVSSPAQPKFTGQTEVLSDVIYDVAVSGSYAYVINYNVIRVIDISNPQTPKPLGFCTMPDGGSSVKVVGSYAYVAAGRSGLRIIDISNPSAPFEVWLTGGPSSVQFGDPYTYSNDVAVLGSFAYVTNHHETHDWLEIINIENPFAPMIEGSVDIPGYLGGVAVAGNYAHVASYGSGLHIINISNPAMPVETGFVDIIGAFELAVIGNYAYVSGQHRFTIVNISDPTNPTSVGAYDGQGYNQGLAVAGDYAYLGNDLTGLVIINVSNPAAPAKAGSYNTTLPDSAVRMISMGKYLYIADNKGGMRIIDISNPISPTEIGFYDTGANVWALSIFGKYAYIAEGDDGLHIIDISNPASLSEAAFYNPPYPVGSVEAVVGDYAFINDGFGGIYIVDISDLSRPVQTGFYNFYGRISKASVVGNYLYAAVWASGKSGLRILDISDPSNPIEIGYYITGDDDIEVIGNYAYLAGASLLQIFDISNPAAPIEVGSCGLPGGLHINSVVVVGNYAYGYSMPNGLYIIDISNPTYPDAVGLYENSGRWIYGIAVSGNYAFIAYGNFGLGILRLQTDKVVESIPISGGSLVSTDGSTNLIFPSGTFTQTVDVTYRQLLYQEHSSYWALVDHVFDISAMNSETGQAASLAPGQTFTMTYTYSDSEIGSAFEDTLGFFYWNGETWLKEPSSTIDTVNNIITGTPNHLSLWAIMGDTNRFFMPLVGK